MKLNMTVGKGNLQINVESKIWWVPSIPTFTKLQLS